MIQPDRPSQRSTDAHASNDDAAVETVLAALRTAGPLPGFEDRTLRGIQRRAREPRAAWKESGRFPQFAPPRVFATATAFAVAMALLLAATHFRPSKAGAPMVSRTRPVLGADRRQPYVATASLPGARMTLQARKSIPIKTAVTKTATANTATARTAVLEDRVEQASYPAPPMPLTDQEQMLLQIAHHRNAANFAALDPRHQDLEIAQANAEFRDFFYHPPLPPNPVTADAGSSQPDTATTATYQTSTAERGKE